MNFIIIMIKYKLGLNGSIIIKFYSYFTKYMRMNLILKKINIIQLKLFRLKLTFDIEFQLSKILKLQIKSFFNYNSNFNEIIFFI
jgi:hypothetical protein